MRNLLVPLSLIVSYLLSPVYASTQGWESSTVPEKFEHIVIDGRVNVLIDGKSAKNVIKYKTPYVSISTHNKVMTITGTENQSADVSIRLFMAEGLANLKSLTINGKSNLTARGLVGPHQININTDGRVLLEGYLRSPDITQSGHAKTEVLWLKGDDARIQVRNGYLKIAGSLARAYVSVDGQAKFDAKHLRVDDLWLNARDQSQVVLYPAKEFHAVVADRSSVSAVFKPRLVSQVVGERSSLIYQSIFNT